MENAQVIHITTHLEDLDGLCEEKRSTILGLSSMFSVLKEDKLPIDDFKNVFTQL